VLRIRSDRGFRQLLLLQLGVVDNDPRIQRQQPLRRRQQRINVDLLDPAVLDNKLAEAHEQLFQAGDIYRLAATNPLQRPEDSGLFHEPARQGRVQRRQRQSSIPEYLHQLAAGTEEHDRPELRIHAAADNQLVSAQLHHRLHRDALEMFGAGLVGHEQLNQAECPAHRLGVGQIQHHAAYVSLVRDGVRVEFDHYRVADFFRSLDGFIHGGRDPRFHRRNAVRLQQFFGLMLGEYRAPGCPDVLNDLLRFLPLQRRIRVLR